jgi:hypothetical protein
MFASLVEFGRREQFGGDPLVEPFTRRHAAQWACLAYQFPAPAEILESGIIGRQYGVHNA